MQESRILGMIVVLLTSTEALARPCINGVCNASTAEELIRYLPSDKEYSVSHSKLLDQVELPAPVELIGLPFKASWSRFRFASDKDSNAPSLHFEYEFHPKNGQICKERYETLLNELSAENFDGKGFTPQFLPGETGETVVSSVSAQYGLHESREYRTRRSKAILSDSSILVYGSDAPTLRDDRNCKLFVRIASETR